MSRPSDRERIPPPKLVKETINMGGEGVNVGVSDGSAVDPPPCRCWDPHDHHPGQRQRQVDTKKGVGKWTSQGCYEWINVFEQPQWDISTVCMRGSAAARAIVMYKWDTLKRSTTWEIIKKIYTDKIAFPHYTLRCCPLQSPGNPLGLVRRDYVWSRKGLGACSACSSPPRLGLVRQQT